MKTIIVATDFSAAASNAANYAADMAIAVNADLFLLHVYEIPVGYLEIPVPINIDELEWNAKSQIHKLKEDLLRRTGNKISITTEAKNGALILELKSICENIKPYMVVMGCQGTTAADHLFFGSRTIEAMKMLQWPLTTVPITSTYSLIKNIGLACDLEKVNEIVPVEEIKMLLKDLNAKLHIINTGKKEEFIPGAVFQSGVLKEMLHEFNPQFHFLSSDNVDDGVLDFIDKNNIDLLITLPKHHDLLNSILHKSHSKKFIRHSHVPVVVLHRAYSKVAI